MKYFAIISVLVFCLAAGNPFPYTENKLQKYSHLNYTWWGFKVYKAEVWTPGSVKPDFDKEILLHLTYQRDIEAKALLETTLDEWKRLKLEKDDKYKKWIAQLKNIWPDVKEGDSLTTYLNGDVTSFYQGKKLLGQIKDRDFGSIFLKIWLHEKSKTASLIKRN